MADAFGSLEVWSSRKAGHRVRRGAAVACGVMLVLLAVPRARSIAADDASRPPNIVLIFADDLGWKDVGFQGTDFYETPRLDRLAAEGMIFSAGYSSAGNCQPSRACLLSGQYTPRHHVYAVGSTDRGPKQRMRLKPIPNRSGLAPAQTTIADALREAGYATGIFGKWHLGGKDGAEPGEQGFDVVVDKNYGGTGERDDPKGIYTLTEAACDFIERNRERPFFAYVSHHAIHTGLQARPETLARFKAKAPGEQHTHALYAACTYDLDDGVGRLLDRLRELELEDNTLVVFTSDNGATPQSLQEPLRGNKGSYHEGGIRVPFVVRWPGVVPAGTRCDAPVTNVDLFPTFLAAAGVPTANVPIANSLQLDGESLLPLFRQEGPLHREAVFWHFPGYLDRPVTRGRDPVFRTRPVSVINKDHWKLYLYHEEWQLDGGRERIDSNRAVELYNLREDIGERDDLAATATDKRDELISDLLAWFKQTGAMLPEEPNPEYRPDDDAAGDENPSDNAKRLNTRQGGKKRRVRAN